MQPSGRVCGMGKRSGYIKTSFLYLEVFFFSSSAPIQSSNHIHYKRPFSKTSVFRYPLSKCLPATATPAPAPTASATAAPAAPAATKQASHNACRSNTSSATRSSNNHDDNKSMRQQTRPSTSSSSPTDFSSSSVDSTYSRSPSASASSSVSWGLDLYPIRIGGRGPGSFGGHGAWRGY